MNSKYDFQQIVFSLDEYDDVKAMWDDISDLLRVLINDGYQCKVYDDSGTDIIIVEFDFIDEGIATGDLRWTTWEECEHLELLNSTTCGECDNCSCQKE